MWSVVRDLRLYVSRPIIPLCFGIPLLLPATLLTVVAFLQDSLSPALHVLGLLFLSLAIISIALGVALGLRDVCGAGSPRSTRPVTRGFQRVERPEAPGSKTPASGKSNSRTPESLSSPNSQNSSRRSSVSVGSVSCQLVVAKETARLVAGKSRKGKKLHRFLLPSRSIRPSPPTRPALRHSPSSRMPALQEEDHAPHPHTPLPPDTQDAQQSGLRRERSLQRLEQHLREVGLGMNTATPVHVEVTQADSQAPNGATPSWKRGHSLVRSMPEEEIHKMMNSAEDKPSPIVPGSAREEQWLRRSARARREGQEVSQQQPVLTGESHERTGIRGHMGSTLL